LAEQHVLFLNGEAYIEFDVKESYRRNQLLQAILYGKEGDSQGFESVEIKMRTVRRNAVLLVCWCQTAHLKLKVSSERFVWACSIEVKLIAFVANVDYQKKVFQLFQKHIKVTMRHLKLKYIKQYKKKDTNTQLDKPHLTQRL